MTELYVTIPESLYRELVDQHETIKEHDPFVLWRPQFRVHCRACDGAVRHSWLPGDPEYRCATGRRIDAYRDVDA